MASESRTGTELTLWCKDQREAIFPSDHDSLYSSKGQKNTEGMSEQQESDGVAALQFCSGAT